MPSTLIEIILTAILIVVSGYAAVQVGMYIGSRDARIKALEETLAGQFVLITEQKAEIEKLSNSQVRHLPNGHSDKIMDLIANLNYIEINQEADLERTRTAQKMARGILNVNKRKEITPRR